MNVVSNCPLRVASLLWQPKPGQFVLTIVAKATYVLAPGVSPLATEQDTPNEEDAYWNDDTSRSLHAPSDLVPYKPRSDVLLIGHAYAPHGQPARSLVARLAVAEIDKAIEVWTDRTALLDGTIREGAPFTRMAIRYERAAAGAMNPAGVRSDAPASGHAQGGVPLPNLQPPGLRVPSAPTPIETIGFGPLAPHWPARLAKLPNRAFPLRPGWNNYPLPSGLDPSYFNAAPQDQQVDRSFRADEAIVLENLHPQHPLLRTSLPGLSPKASVERGPTSENLPMSPDTLWIDTDRGICTLTWRGQLRLDRPNAPGRVVVSMELAVDSPEEPISEADIEVDGPDTVDRTPLVPNMSVARIGAAKPDEDCGETTLQPTRSRGPIMPFLASSSPAANPAPTWQPSPVEASPADDSAGETIIARIEKPAAQALPFAQSGDPLARPPIPAKSASSPFPATRELLRPNPPPPAAPPSPQGSLGRPPHSTPMTIGQAAMEAPPEAPPPPPLVIAIDPKASVKSTESMPPVVSSSSTETVGGAAPKVGAVSTLKRAKLPPEAPPTSAAGASNAAADAKSSAVQTKPSTPAGAQRQGAPIDLLWLDAPFADPIRKTPAFAAILEAYREKADPPDEKKPQSKPQTEARDDIAALLAQGDAISLEKLNAATAAALHAPGAFKPPLILLAGELEFPFDEVETLKATLAAVTPLSTGDKKLKDMIETIGELMKTPWLQSAGSMTERLTAQIKETFTAGNRLLPPGYLDTHTERILLEHRHYQKRTLLGQAWIRAFLVIPGSTTRIPTYLPHGLARELPMFQRFSARIIAEARPQMDQYEVCPVALRGVALGRVLGAMLLR